MRRAPIAGRHKHVGLTMMPETHRSLKALAQEKGVPMGDVIDALIRFYYVTAISTSDHRRFGQLLDTAANPLNGNEAAKRIKATTGA